MTASEIIARARSLADLGNTKFIDHTFELNSLNESWKDIYSVLLENDNDYYVTETTLTLSPAVAVAGTSNEYLLPLPTDVAKVRYLDYRGSMDWLPMNRFNLGMKDNQPGDPYYRIKNAHLWIIGGSVPATGLSIRLGYYPAPSAITAADWSYQYTTSLTLAALAGVTYPAYAALNNTAVYALTVTFVITAESVDRNTTAAPVALFTEAAAVTSLHYYKGYLYWIRGANIYRKATDLTVLFVAPGAVTATNDVIDFQIYNDLIYFCTAAAIKWVALAGGAQTSLGACVPVRGAALLNAVVYYVNAAGALLSLTPASTLVATGISNVTSDGTYLYALTTAYAINRYTIVANVITATDVLFTDALSMGPCQGGRLPVIQNLAQTLIALDVSPNYNFSFPNNLVPEIMAYRGAIDYRIRQSQDAAALTLRLAELWDRFGKMVKRDEYQSERIRNAYQGDMR